MSDQQADPRPGFYYVSIIDGERTALARGPFYEHRMALEAVDPVREILCDMNPWAHFCAFGTCRSEVDQGPGILDELREGPP